MSDMKQELEAAYKLLIEKYEFNMTQLHTLENSIKNANPNQLLHVCEELIKHMRLNMSSELTEIKGLVHGQ